MAKAQRLFRNIWRINAVIILIAGILLALAGLAALYELASFVTRDRTIGNVVLQDGPKTETRLSVGSFELLRGVPAAIAPYRREQIRRGQGNALSSYSKSTSSIVDYIVVNTEDGSSWRVVGEDNAIVAKHWLLPQRTARLLPGESAGRVALIAVSAVLADTNGDGRITLKDKKHLVVAMPDGRQKKQIAESIEQVLLLTLRDGSLRLIYQEVETERLILRIVDPNSLAVLSEREIKL